MQFGPGEELACQPRLAEAGISYHGNGGKRALFADGRKDVLEARELGLTTDHRRLDPLHTAHAEPGGGSLFTRNQESAQRLIAALDRERRLFSGIEAAAHMAPGVVGDAQSTVRRGLLHAPGEVDGRAHRAVVGLDTPSEQHLAGVDADPDRETGQPVVPLDLRGVKFDVCEQRKSGTHGAFGIVFAADVGSERGRQTVAREAQYAAPVRFDDRPESTQCAVHHGHCVFGVERLAHARRVDHVGKQDGDVFQPLGAAAIELFEFGEVVAQRCQRDIDHRITQHSALRFQSRDGLLDLLAFVHACATTPLTAPDRRVPHADAISR